ncbi:hypothetical protein [Glutamicibacter sp.]|uniref:hypothetical protein n=1 Tax=Glutamicibacter sp. TaxID=1931995 RepID=UPI002B473E3F|nr:hypothetical protein [Glutamicibacter sp.]HJX77314.1 hypothetical protein [Glutamicibacter sp.]
MRLYKAVITDIPSEAKVNFWKHFPELSAIDDSPEEWGYSTWDYAETLIQNPDWKPSGWAFFLDDRANSGTQWAVDLIEDDYKFVWPNMGGMFKSRSAARERAKRAERWGATVTIMEAEVSEFVPVAEANARRKIQAMNVRADRLQSKADLIRTQSEVVAIKAGINDLPF